MKFPKPHGRLAAIFFASLQALSAMDAPSGLLCNLLVQPEKSLITESQPDFGWIVNSKVNNDVQTAYQILLASSPDLLTKGRGDLWDTGKVVSTQSINILYGGKPLSPMSSYWWCVRTWNKDGAESAFSAAQMFRTGEFNRPGKKWPAESRWVEIPDDQGGMRWTFENRPPVNFHPQPATRVLTRPDGVWFLDFGKAAFATLQATIDWKPAGSAAAEHIIQVAVGEKAKGNAVDPKPGGGIIYQKIPLKIRPGKHTYTLEVPRFKPHYPHSQAMPVMLPDVIPFRYCELMPGTEKITVEKPGQLALWVDFDDSAAAFSSSNQALDDVYDLCKYSIKVNTFNGDYAASQRERMMYEADSYIHQMSHYATDRSFATARYSSENMIFHASWPTEWISHSIFMAWADYLHTGNSRSMARYYDELKPKTLLALAGEDGLISTRNGRQTKEFLKSIHFNNQALKDIVDWPQSEADGYEFRDFNTVVNAFHYRSLVLMTEIARSLGKPAAALEYASRAERVKAAINASMLDAVRGIYIDGIGSSHASLHANLFPLAFGIVPPERRETVVDFIKSRGMACSVYPAIYLLEALYDSGEEQAALDLMTATHDRGWLHMLRAGSTVTTEAWDVKYKNNSGWTHAWSASPAQILPRKLLGIEPVEPGFGKVRIQPRPGNLSHAKTRLPTIRGTIDAAFSQPGDGSFHLDVTLPANMSAEISLPIQGDARQYLTVDGKPVDAKITGGRIVLGHLGSGNHRIVRQASR